MIPTRAYRLDAPAIVALRDDLARWQIASGIDQWKPGEYDPDEVRDQIVDGQWWVIRDDGALTATVRILESDPIWDDLVAPDDVTALYVHGLMVRRIHAGRGIGDRLLEFAQDQVRERDRTVLRLDCAAANARLRDYYASRGFTELSEREFPPPYRTLVRWEKPLV